jgi:hypothetical protein
VLLIVPALYMIVEDVIWLGHWLVQRTVGVNGQVQVDEAVATK